ncbi:MAG: tyrosine-type recombinase/integrase [Lachnospiraceae bacterium]|nr:tyrosine-type recombinase/integrase [Lachnospiraceae bacterium]
MLISEAFDLYKYEFIQMKGQSSRTEEMHDYVCKNLICFFGDINIADLSIVNIRNWFTDLMKTRCQNTVRGYIIKLRRVLDYCKKRKIIDTDVSLIQIPRRQNKVPEFLTEQEIDRMINKAPNYRSKFVISLLYSSGIRLSEMISLSRNQIYERRFTVIGKGNKPRLCFIDERTEKLMNIYLRSRQDHSNALIVSYENKNRITRTNVELLVKNAARRAGVLKHVTPHTMRHSYATNFLRNGGNIRVLQVLLGHESLETTMIYTHIVYNDLEEQYQKYHSI